MPALSAPKAALLSSSPSASSSSSSTVKVSLKRITDCGRMWTSIFFFFCLFCYFSCGESAAVKAGCHKYGRLHVIDEEGCDLISVQVNVCSGYCTSFSFIDPVDDVLTVHGKCCRMVDREWVNVKLNCADGERTVRVPTATECSCFDCATSH